MLAQEDSIVVDGSVMDYVTFGKGDRPLLLLQGLTLKDVKGSGAGLALMYRIFSEKYKVYCIDRKRDIPEGYTIGQLAEDCARAMKALHIEQADVLGISQGGMIAQHLAAEHPELVHSLVLGVTAAKLNKSSSTCINGWIELAEQGRFADLVRETMGKIYSEQYLKKYGILLTAMAKTYRPSNPGRFINLAKACMTMDMEDRLDQIRCPVLVLGGAKDLVLTGEASVELAEKLGCELYMYEQLGHSAYEEGKDFNKRVYDFFMRRDSALISGANHDKLK